MTAEEIKQHAYAISLMEFLPGEYVLVHPDIYAELQRLARNKYRSHKHKSRYLRAGGVKK